MYGFLSFLLFFTRLVKSQVIVLCVKQSDCYIDSYCDTTTECNTCDYIKPGQCDVLSSDCCSQEFLDQCPNNPYKCNDKNHILVKDTQMNDGLYVFLCLVSIGGTCYLLIGSYYNKYVLLKRGVEIIPNVNFWNNFGELVKDGFYFTFYKGKNYLKNYNRL